VELTGGLFVCVPGDDPGFADKFLAGAGVAGVPAREISVAEALRREPRLNPGITRAIEVSDGSVDGWRLVRGVANSAAQYGAQVLTYHQVTGIGTDGSGVTHVSLLDRGSGEQVRVDAGFVINAAGPWAGQVAGLAGCAGVDVVPGRGIMVGMNHRLTRAVINRCVYPTDGDILVPAHTICVMGTTDTRATDPDRLDVPAAEIEAMLDCGEQLVPGFRQTRVLHVWAGARPLVRDARVGAGDTRHMSRGMSIIDHKQRDGIAGLITVAGGKLTTYRLMAQNTVDAMEAQLGVRHPCRTADEVVSEDGVSGRVSRRLAEREADPTAEVVCECELVTREMLADQMRQQPAGQFDDWRRLTRLGMGPCQGTFCGLRAAGLATEMGLGDAPHSTTMLRLFLRHRWLGLRPGLSGAQAKQAALSAAILCGTLDLPHAPQAPVPPQFASSGAVVS